jgi:prepilin-type N-terminal cleavage/methylation domain-containing protein
MNYPNHITRSRPQRRGYTMVELVMAMGIFAIGITGVAAMQTATSASNRHAKNLAIASAIAKTWQEELAIDAVRWDMNNPLVGALNTTWIRTATGNWALPANNAAVTMGPAFDAIGNFTNVVADTAFCVHIRLTPLLQTTPPTPTGTLMRAEVRVLWPKLGANWTEVNFCTLLPNQFRAFNAAATAAGNTEVDNFHFVYATSALRENPGAL